ncbi:MAG TPA: Xaa-Pro peptidase family protein, partial [Gaiellaceae bacterium]|nr:Xaa-Pro peptidase family protein [Gaiellaceae bacterium]
VDLLRASLEEPLLVTNGVNVRYLVGFSSSNAALHVEPEHLRLFSDFRYAEAARAVEGVEFVETKRSLVGALAELLEGTVGFEADAVSYASWEVLRAGGLELVPRRGLVEALRAVKDESELEAISRAGEITSEAYARFADERFVGCTERALAWRLDELFHELGADAPAFETIVASGPNAARPHARPTDRTIEAGETVVVDAGAMVDGYNADCTRTFATGPLPDELKAAYEATLEGQLAGLAAVRAGVTGVDADEAARDKIEAAGFGGNFGHGLGHGVGLEVHEAPRLSRESTDTLAAGSVVTVEPGVYLEALGGIRIEDLVIVTDDEPEVLTSFDKDLITVS